MLKRRLNKYSNIIDETNFIQESKNVVSSMGGFTAAFSLGRGVQPPTHKIVDIDIESGIKQNQC